LVSDGWRIVITHGNGPQVGAELLRSAHAAADAYPLPLDVCVACTQGEIGSLLQQAVAAALAAAGLRRAVVTVLTHVVVSAGDPAFAHPSKPIGPWYSREQAEAARRDGWTIHEIPPHGFRRVVASPEPLRIVEEDAIRTLLTAGIVVIALGGGGIPVVPSWQGLRGTEAVIDKDLASSLLASHLGVERFLIATDVERVYLGYGRPGARPLDTVSADVLRRHAEAHPFAAGSMGPKVDAALRFVEATGGDAIITAHDHLVPALQGRAGTHVRARAPARAGRG
jgi:carbamate kinase